MSEGDASLGARLHQRRKELGRTMREVAKDSGLTVGFISQIERDISRPSLSSLYAIARALDTSVDRFLSQAPERAHRQVTHSAARPRFSLGASKPVYEFLEPGFDEARLNACITHVPPGFASEVMRHEGEDFVYLIAGIMIYTVDGVAYRLQAGDTLHFNSTLPHTSRNPGDEVATELWVGTMRLFADKPHSSSPPSGPRPIAPEETTP
ncbi:MAG: cupin domain-containing protein [Devosia sp.]|nr:cupin domain-containing protein [Devosia sp.]